MVTAAAERLANRLAGFIPNSAAAAASRTRDRAAAALAWLPERAALVAAIRQRATTAARAARNLATTPGPRRWVTLAAVTLALVVTPAAVAGTVRGSAPDPATDPALTAADLEAREQTSRTASRSHSRTGATSVPELSAVTPRQDAGPEPATESAATAAPEASPATAAQEAAEPEAAQPEAAEQEAAVSDAAEQEAAVPEAAEQEAAPEPEPTPTKVAPVGGLNQTQMDHAATIVRVGQEMGLPERAYVVAIATALQETYLRNLANPSYAQSLNIPNDGRGFDHDSVGLFQQRPSMGWGTVAQCMDPEYAAGKFYERLRTVRGWENLPVTVAAQRVQVSAFPNHYAKHEPLAWKIVSALA